MKINLKFDYKTILPFVLKRFSLVLWVFLGLILVAEGLTIKSSLDKINAANAEPLLNNAQLLRVNFGNYDAIEKRLSHNQAFIPQEPTITDPFGLPVKK